MRVGDYVRFKDKRGNTYIRKIIDLPQDIRYGAIEIDIETNYSNMLSPKNIIKSSPNIIDLIEENDLLKIEYYSPRYRKRLTRLFEVEYKSEKYLTLKNAHCDFNLIDNKFNKKDKRLKPIIKSIITKEQFESMEYKIGE